jgi:hypothetical protein
MHFPDADLAKNYMEVILPRDCSLNKRSPGEGFQRLAMALFCKQMIILMTHLAHQPFDICL